MVGMLKDLVRLVHEHFLAVRRGSREEVWEAFVAAVEASELWTSRSRRQPRPASDGSIFVSIASYRDASLNSTLHELFDRAADPRRVTAGVVAQNCVSGCFTGAVVVSTNPPRTVISEAPPDRDGVAEFCASSLWCDRVRLLAVNESESLGPAFARFLASKLWFGEEFFVQIDAHVWFVQDWDRKLVAELRSTPSFPKSVLSAYPPPHEGGWQSRVSSKLCAFEFSTSPVESQIIRIGPVPAHQRSTPPRASFVAAGFFATHASFLSVAPFDPFLPFCFMGEEILLSARFWTNGFDIYAPTTNLCAHEYRPGRLGLPKFWETTTRTFGNRPGFQNTIAEMVIDRVKHVVGYPNARLLAANPRVFAHVEDFGIGTARSLDDFLRFVAIDFDSKSPGTAPWCLNDQDPPA